MIMKRVYLALIPAVFVTALFVGNLKNTNGIDSYAAKRDKINLINIYMEDAPVALAPEIQIDNTKAIAKKSFDRCNEIRDKLGISPLKWSNALEESAAVRCREASDVWSHTRPDGSEWWTVNSKIMYGENLAKGYTTAEAAVSAWMASPSHKENIIDSSFRSCAIAITEKDGIWYWAEEFGY